MLNIFAMSDIHGFIKPLEDNLAKINLENADNSLIFCGDYIDYGPDSCKVIYRIMTLSEKYKGSVIAIKGNHEAMFIDFLSLPEQDIQVFEWLNTDKDFMTIFSFVSDEIKAILLAMQSKYHRNVFIEKAIPIVRKDILENHRDLVYWLRNLPLYYETDKQIFVHAGIDEEAEDLWTLGTTEEIFLSKYPYTIGKFYKDVIAGHISTSTISGIEGFCGVFWDGKSHFYLDGNTRASGVIPLLRYEVESGVYYGDGVKIG